VLGSELTLLDERFSLLLQEGKNPIIAIRKINFDRIKDEQSKKINVLPVFKIYRKDQHPKPP
jgi:hypothetical protein